MFLRRMINAISQSSESGKSDNSAYALNIDHMEIPIEEWSHKVVTCFLYKEQFFELIPKVTKLKYEGVDFLTKNKEQLTAELKVHEDEITELMARIESVKVKQKYYSKANRLTLSETDTADINSQPAVGDPSSPNNTSNGIAIKNKPIDSTRNMSGSPSAQTLSASPMNGSRVPPPGLTELDRQRRGTGLERGKLPSSPTGATSPSSSSISPPASSSGEAHLNISNIQLLKIVESFKRQLKENDLLAERSYRLNKYKNTFTGSDATTLLHKLMRDVAKSATRFDAIDLGNAMIRDGFIKHVAEDEDFKDEPGQLYFISDDPRARDSLNLNNKKGSSAFFAEEDRSITKDIMTPAATDLIYRGDCASKMIVLIKNTDTLLESLIFQAGMLNDKEKKTLEAVTKKLKNLNYPVPEVQISLVAQDLSLSERYLYSYLNPNRIPRAKKTLLQEKSCGKQFMDIGLALTCTEGLAGEFYTFALIVGTFIVEFSDRCHLALVREKDSSFVNFFHITTINDKENIELCLKTVSKCCVKWNEKPVAKNINSKTFVTELFRWIDIPESVIETVASDMDFISNYPINSKSLFLQKGQLEEIYKVSETVEITSSLQTLLSQITNQTITFYKHSDLAEFYLIASHLLNPVQKLLISSFAKTFMRQFNEGINLPNSEPMSYKAAKKITKERLCKIDDVFTCPFKGHGICTKNVKYPKAANSENETPVQSESSPSDSLTYQYFPCNISLPTRQ
ncbi:predicted protein [Naegleria gruberi]|uniref:Predicted protein n=1 Tax=Naegleria gruberi TaxID=5762 RepID=D2V5G3_NAEGR|nr:uncharacterized protein NAEGRDRAFT_46676 [Naegleria gruberi]EFC47943.1 predicted protein [Naegleria gruberi]|eukprot:XP_002680687.1 predicted protein [Naegleria gruberi strain NEG-M]